MLLYNSLAGRLTEWFRSYVYASTAVLVGIEVTFLVFFQQIAVTFAASLPLTTVAQAWLESFVLIAAANWVTDYVWLGHKLDAVQKLVGAFTVSLFLPVALATFGVTSVSLGGPAVAVFIFAALFDYAGFFLTTPHGRPFGR